MRSTQEVDRLLDDITAVVERHGVHMTWGGWWFHPYDLYVLARLAETHGWGIARLYQVGRVDRRLRGYFLQRERALLDIVDLVLATEIDDLTRCYTVRQINSMLLHNHKPAGG